MDKILITGGSGLLGSNLAKVASSRFDVYATYNRNQTTGKNILFLRADLTNNASAEKLKQIRPDSIVHCAALTDVDFCEKHPEEAYRHNVLASSNVARIASEVNASLVHISTDMVFDGRNGKYKEEDAPNPMNQYGKSKLTAEQSVQAIYPSACIIRTNIYGWNKLNKYSLAEWMLDKLMRGEELPALQDAYFSPILVNHLAETIFSLLEVHYTGMIHVAASESCSKLDFAFQIANVFGLDDGVIRPVSFEELGLEAPRPKNTTLDVTKVESVVQKSMPSVAQGLMEMAKLRDAGYVDALKHE